MRRIFLNTGPRVLHSHNASRTVHTAPDPSQGLKLDPSLRQLLRDADLSLLKTRKHDSQSNPPPPELEATPLSEEDAEAWEGYTLPDESLESVANAWHDRAEKLSPEARFGSKHIGSISVPKMLEQRITDIIEETDKHQLRSDTKRLFLKEDRSSSKYGNQWTTELPDKFKGPKRHKASRVSPREALSFAVISIPSHYGAISNVLQETQKRLGSQWSNNVTSLVDFGSGTGVGIWATLDLFRKPSTFPIPISNPEPIEDEETSDIVDPEDPEQVPLVENPLQDSSIRQYLALENRPAMLSISKKLTTDVSLGDTKIKVEKFWGQDGHDLKAPSAETVAMMAFTLSELPTDSARRMMLREMWKTGADVMIVIDHGSTEGFKIVSDARSLLLSMGQKSLAKASSSSELVEDDASGESSSAVSTSKPGSHVVAPCPHDGTCPMTILKPGKNNKYAPAGICRFSQRTVRPKPLRATKHTKRNHEDVLYSYVVIRRGERPKVSPHAEPREEKPSKQEFYERGGKRVLVEASTSPAASPSVNGASEVLPTEPDVVHLEWAHRPASEAEIRRQDRHWVSDAPPRNEEDIRVESYSWNRVIRPPLKRSGHVILDSCTRDGSFARHTIPRSQGKQQYYDARKSSWGDSFPWDGKHGGVIRQKGDGSAEEVSEESLDLKAIQGGVYNLM